MKSSMRNFCSIAGVGISAQPISEVQSEMCKLREGENEKEDPM